MEVRLSLILAVCTVFFQLANTQPRNQTTGQVITSEMRDNVNIRENLQNFFDSISKHDTKKNEILNGILKQDVMVEQHAFDTLKGDLQIARNRDSQRRRNSYDKSIASGNFVPAKREAGVKHDFEPGGWDSKPSIYDFTLQEFTEWMEERGKSPPISDRIWKAVYRQRVNDFKEINELSSSTRSLLDRELSLPSMEEDEIQYAKDGTIKCLLKLTDGNRIETVLMEQKYGLTICITSQVGCNIGCTFCASGLLRKKRDLTSGEMVQQVLHMQRILDAKPDQKSIRNIVIMGIGEPFDNYDHVLRFIRTIDSRKGFGIGGRHITVSTSGLARQIKAFANEAGVNANLAISLHAANNALRTRIMKLNKAIPIERLMEATDYYLNKTRRKVAFEYILLKDINDSESCAIELANLVLARSQPNQIYVNLIPYNPVSEADNYQRSPPETVFRFHSTLNGLGVRAITRAEFGTDIDAACGQLRSKQLDNEKKRRT